MRRFLLHFPLALAAWSAGAAAGAPVSSWDFEARLDGRLIGQHRFELHGPPQQRALRSQARFEVRVLGLVVYRYEHTADEQWQGDCLSALSARTLDNGTERVVSAEAVAGGLRVQAGPGDASLLLPGCVMGFAYWNPALRGQSRLLNVQTGALEAVRTERLPDAPVLVRGADVPASGWRIHAQGQRIDVWYTAAGDWVALDATLAGGRRLSYRLPPGSVPATPRQGLTP